MRQTFTEGQRVYIKRWGSGWDPAIIYIPEVVKHPSHSSRPTYYVTITYIETAQHRAGQNWDVPNNRRQICTEEAYPRVAA